ncbi:hypothetical protein FXF51_02985 [Nonomuraea sp. PA05]|uniref:hypothetical protein n=1 Tax=Nonomuraea sp. PA05 TaxID=2604466 RepID=UPI0011DA3243|nr:hypothetical protein [Nonomuraea sp. PA05]TYB71404.1 hypothetical protein FXF51_02985 [Nonomuraea sp. PA05]
MKAPSKLRLAVAGLAVGGVLAGSGLTAGAAHAQVDDPFGFGGSSGGSSFDFGLTAPQPGSGSSGSSSSGGFGDFLKDLGKDLGKQLGQEALNKLLKRDKNNNNTTQTQPQVPAETGTVPSEDLTLQGPATTTSSKRVPESVEKVLREAGISLVDWIVKRQPGDRRRGFGSFKEPDRFFRPELQRQFCRVPGNVRLFGTTVRRGRFQPTNFIGGDNLGRTLVLGRNSFLAPSGNKLKRFSTVNYVFVSKRGAEVLRPQPRVAKNTVLEDRDRYPTDFLKRGVKYTVVVRYINTCNEPVVDVIGKVRRR